MPVHQTARQAQACTQQVTGKIQQLPGAKGFAQKLHANLVELMGLIKNNGIH